MFTAQHPRPEANAPSSARNLDLHGLECVNKINPCGVGVDTRLPETRRWKLRVPRRNNDDDGADDFKTTSVPLWNFPPRWDSVRYRT